MIEPPDRRWSPTVSSVSTAESTVSSSEVRHEVARSDSEYPRGSPESQRGAGTLTIVSKWCGNRWRTAASAAGSVLSQTTASASISLAATSRSSRRAPSSVTVWPALWNSSATARPSSVSPPVTSTSTAMTSSYSALNPGAGSLGAPRRTTRATVLRCFDGGIPHRRSLGFQGVYGINVSLCYWTVARYETPIPARRDHRLDNAGNCDIWTGRRARSRDGRVARAGTGDRCERMWPTADRDDGHSALGSPPGHLDHGVRRNIPQTGIHLAGR